MCRIIGIVDFKNSLGNKLKEATLLMRDSMVHGGPDDAGLFISEDNRVAFGNRRLSIIDLSQAGHQPMSNENETIWITYNGEIYNYKELRDELVSAGYRFRSNTDTEVIVNGYEAWGIEKLLVKLRGMFVFAIYDGRNKNNFKVYLARDRFGIKPFYYYKNEDLFVFASEVKAFLQSGLVQNIENKDALIRFLFLGSVSMPFTTIKGIYSLPAGCFACIEQDLFKINKYWELGACAGNSYNNHELIKQRTATLLNDSINLHLNSDAPLGIFLSGGVDSSILLALASEWAKDPIVTLSVVFEEEEYSEAKYAKLVADKFGSNHKEILIRSKDFYDEIPLITNSMDQPTVDGVNSYFVSKAAKESGLKVVLSGVGADEIFLGYSHFRKIRTVDMVLRLLSNMPYGVRKLCINSLSGIGNRYKKLEFVEKPTYENAYLLFRGLFTSHQVQELIGVSDKELKTAGNMFAFNELQFDSLFGYFNCMEFGHYLQDQILKDIDFMSMKHSIEVRVPFLDHKLVEFVLSVGSDEKMKRKINKSLLVESVGEKLPSQIYNREKMGFTLPFAKWLKRNWQFFEDSCLLDGMLNKSAVKKIWKGVSEGNMHWSYGWTLYVFSMFRAARKEKVCI